MLFNFKNDLSSATQGFVASIFELLKFPLMAPNYSLLCLRQKRLSLKIPYKKSISEGMHLVVDSTGLKLYGEGEWKVRQINVALG